MQYSFTLPANYDMTIIEKRIADNGAKLNGFPGLLFKAYLFAQRDDLLLATKENRYGSLYVWKNTDAMAHFLQCSGFTQLTQDFGWPEINIWNTLCVPLIDEIKNAKCLSIATQRITPYSNLAALNLVGQLCAWDVSRWQSLSVIFTPSPLPNRENYRMGYLASEEY